MDLFSGRRFLVTGASGGVGAAIARRLGENGADVILTGRNRARLTQAAAQLPEKRGQSFLADLSKEGERQALVRQILGQDQRLDGVIHCAAMMIMGSLAQVSAEDFDRQFQINVVAPFRLNQLLLPALTAAQGQVIFINSSVGRIARAEVGQYAATKHALKALAESLRDECNSAGVRVCSLFLGATATPMQETVRAQQERPYQPEKLVQPDDVARVICAVLSLPQTAEVTDIALRPTARA